MLSVLLLGVALGEALFSDEQPSPTFVRLLAAAVPPVAVAFSRTRPSFAACAVVGVFLVESLQPSPAGTLGAGFAWLTVAYAVSAHTRQPGPWLLALVLASTMRDLRTIEFEPSNVVIDWAFFAFAVGAGHVVRRRTTQAQELANQLRTADAEREERTAQAVTRERAAIARELHDVVANAVSLMVVQAGTARPLAEHVDRELAGVLETIETTGRGALTELRRLLRVLRTTEDADLAPPPDLSGVHDLVEGLRRAGVDVRSSIDVPADVPVGVALCAYRTVQEGLTNALRHADGSPVELEVSRDPLALRVRVRSHGLSSSPQTSGTGTGLIGLRERVLLCGGRLSAGPEAGGYLLDVELPLSADARAADDSRPEPLGMP
ncbi:sensor histidine kinase [Knoellia sp. CPCC 206450]|uniref:sensor histidine kinase n=1 Tax=Knoellia tibetensis TaxID=3404798 RepID=UPI003B4286E8